MVNKRWLIGGLLLCIWGSAFAGTTFKQAKNVLARLANISGYHVVLHYDNDTESQAYSTPYGIYITQGMLNDCLTEGQLAFVLGHELAHYIHQDARQEPHRGFETRADIQGYHLCKKARYKGCKAILYRFRHLYGEGGKDGVHPTMSERIKRLKH